MSFLKFFQSVLAFGTSLTSWLHDRQLIALATKAAGRQKQEEVSDALDRTRDARINAELDIDRHPQRLHDDDGWRRD